MNPLFCELFKQKNCKSGENGGGRHYNPVSTLTLTQCDPPLKAPGYAPPLIANIANRNSDLKG